MADRTLTVRIIGDSRQLRKEFDRSAKSAKGFETRITGIGKSAAKVAGGVGLALGGAELVDQIFKTVQASSDLNEEINKSRVVFGQSADEVLAWSRTTAEAAGVSQRAALGASAGFGQMLITSGLAEDQAADMSRQLVGLAADLASFNNIDPTEALDKLRSGLAGEAEPLRTLGVLLSETRVKQEAYRSGIARTGATLTEQQKVQARYRLILQDTAKAQGDFARTSDSLANKQRTLAASTEDLRARLGQDLAPVLTQVVDGLIQVEGEAVGVARAFGKIPGPIKAVLGPLAVFRANLKFARGAAALLTDEFKEQTDAMIANAAAARDAASAHAAAEQVDRRRIETGALLGNVLAADQSRTADIADKIAQQARSRARAPRRTGGGIDADQRNRIFDEAIGRAQDRVQDVQSLEGQLAALDKIANLITAQIAKVKDISRKLTLRDELVRVRRQQRGIREQIQDAREQEAAERVERERLAKEEARRKRELAQQARIAKLAAQQARQLAALEEPVAGIGALRRRLKSIREQVEGTPLDTDKTTAQLKRIAKVLSGSFGAVGKDVRSAIQQMFRDINDALNEGDKAVGPATKSKLLDVSKVLKGLSGTPEALAAARNALAGAVVPGRAPRTGAPVTAGAGGGQVFAIENLYVNANDADELMRDLQRRTQRKSTTRRG